MKLKSLLFGTAAALVATTGARAADAIVYAEPEPMEYVRICDVYGASFFYIPGTETCLRSRATSGIRSAPTRAGITGPSRSALASTSTLARTPHGVCCVPPIRVEGSWDPANQVADAARVSLLTTDGEAFIDQAFLELGGLRMGYTGSAWVPRRAPALPVRLTLLVGSVLRLPAARFDLVHLHRWQRVRGDDLAGRRRQHSTTCLTSSLRR